MQDPLSFSVPTAGVDRTFPLIPEGDYKLQLTGSKFEPSYDKTVRTWEPQFVTIDPITALDGRTIAPNSKVFLAWPFDLEEKPDPKFPGAWINTLTGAVDAIFGFKQDGSDRPNVDRALLDSATGKVVLCHIIIDEDKRDGTKRNKIKRLKPMTA